MSREAQGIWKAVLLGLIVSLPLVTEGAESENLRTLQECLDVPDTIARITDAQWTAADELPKFILIQDAHRYPDVQNRIATLIVKGYETWGVKKVFVEGAFTPLDFSVFHRIPNRTKPYLLERLLKDGELSGPELAAVLIMEREWRNPPVSPFQLYGMEDPKLYRDNVFAYRSVLAERDRALEAVASIRHLQNSLRLPVQNPLTAQLNLIESLVKLKLTPTEYDAYLRSRAQAPSAPGLDPAVKSAEEFYRLAQLRSRVFLKEAARRAPASTAPRVLVVGGFHTSAMTALLREAHVSYVVLSPVVSSPKEVGDPIYERNLQKTASFLAQAVLPSAR